MKNTIHITCEFFMLLIILALVAFIITDADEKEQQEQAEEDHIAIVGKFHETMHEAKIRHSHPMPLVRKQKGASLR